MFGSGRDQPHPARDLPWTDLRAVKKLRTSRYAASTQSFLFVFFFFSPFSARRGRRLKTRRARQPVYQIRLCRSNLDGLLKNRRPPVVEISFMPKKLGPFNHRCPQSGEYKPNVSPPKSMQSWGRSHDHFAQHLLDRYGINEVAQWYFEVWNEPNIDFWGAPCIPRQTVLRALRHTARALKARESESRVGVLQKPPRPLGGRSSSIRRQGRSVTSSTTHGLCRCFLCKISWASDENIRWTIAFAAR